MKFANLVLGLVLSSNAFAGVLPAHLSYDVVKKFLDKEVAREARIALPDHKEEFYPVSSQSNFMRGKFSTGEHGFAHFFGDTEIIFTHAFSSTGYQVSCSFSAAVQRAGFAMSEKPVLAEVVNDSMLVLNDHAVECRLRH